MTFDEALERELNRGHTIIGNTVDAPCHVCGTVTDLRAGACFDCKEKCETDMIEVWEIANPQNRWPYAWHSEPFADVSEEDAAAILDALNRRK